MSETAGVFPHVGEKASDGKTHYTTTELAERLNRLRDRMKSGSDTLPESWQPKPGESLIGEFQRWSEGTTGRGETHQIAVIADATTGEMRAVWTFYVALREELRRADLKPGDLVGITRLDDGQKKSSDPNRPGATYRRYSVEVER